MVVTTLRIKRVFFDKILSGEKLKEYRDYKPFYKRLFKTAPDAIILHYQKGRKLRFKVLGIRKIRTPKRLQDSICGFGRYVYEISIGRVDLIAE